MAVTTTDFGSIANGSAWPAPWVKWTGTSTIVDVQNGRGRLVKAAAVYNGARVRAAEFLKDFEMTGEWFPQTLAESYMVVLFRFTDGGNRYAFELSPAPNSTMYFSKQSAGVYSRIPGVNVAHSLSVGTAFRLKVQGSTFLAKAWLIGSAEPVDWMLSYTDTDHTQELPVFLDWNEPSTSALETFLDNIVVDDFADITPPAAPTGLTAVKSVA